MATPPSVLAVRGLSAPAAGVAEVVVALGDDLFAGHFPGHPTLSAIGQLAVVEAALSASKGRPGRVAEVGRMRLTRRIAEGEVVVRLEEGDGEGRLGFALLVDGELASRGRVGWVEESGEKPTAVRARDRGPGWREMPTEGRTADRGPAGAEPGRYRAGGLPHAGVARMLSWVLECGGETIACEARLDAASPFAGLGRQAGLAPAWVGLEMAAQAAAALELSAREEGAGGRLGYLVRLRNLRCGPPALPVGEAVRVEATRTAAVATLRTYEVFASVGEEELLRGELSVLFDPSPA